MNQPSNEIKIPIRTKIAARLMMASGLVFLLLIVALLFIIPPGGLWLGVAVAMISIVFYYLIIPYSLLKAQGLPWKWQIGFIEVCTIFSFIALVTYGRSGDYLLVLFIRMLVFFVNVAVLFLLLSDRNNYFEAVEMGKKGEGGLTK